MEAGPGAHHVGGDDVLREVVQVEHVRKRRRDLHARTLSALSVLEAGASEEVATSVQGCLFTNRIRCSGTSIRTNFQQNATHRRLSASADFWAFDGCDSNTCCTRAGCQWPEHVQRCT
jgi:hypothetical protein